MTEPWVLSVDFGTTNTVAAVADAAGVRPIHLSGQAELSSAVCYHRRRWTVGEEALRISRERLECLEPNPKSAIADKYIFLDGQDISVVAAICAVLQVVFEAADREQNKRPPGRVVITHPADWAPARIETLLEAADAAASRFRGWPTATALPEPVAAAHHALGRRQIPTKARLVVLDIGGHAATATVVDRQGDQLAIVSGPHRQDGAAGDDFDLRLARWMVAEVGADGLYDRLASSDDPSVQQQAIGIRSAARSTKEQLSSASFVAAHLPASPPELPGDTPVQVSRAELERLIGAGQPGTGQFGGDHDHQPGLVDAVTLAATALSDAPSGPSFAGIVLVGGSSRTPRLGTLVGGQFGSAPLAYGDPVAAVAYGAAAYGWSRLLAEQAAIDADRAAEAHVDSPRRDHSTMRRRRRRWPAVLVALLVLAGGGVAYTLVKHQPPGPHLHADSPLPFPPEPTVSTRPGPAPATSPTPVPPSPESTPVAAPTTPAGSLIPTTDRALLTECQTSSAPSCATLVGPVLWQMWPELQANHLIAQNCSAERDALGLTESCPDGFLHYLVWARSAITPDVVRATEATMADPSPGVFSLAGSTVGTMVNGLIDSTTYACVWEYSAFQIALEIEGPAAIAEHYCAVGVRAWNTIQMAQQLSLPP